MKILLCLTSSLLFLSSACLAQGEGEEGGNGREHGPRTVTFSLSVSSRHEQKASRRAPTPFPSSCLKQEKLEKTG